ncbi:MAG: hypothetical protein V1752_08665, partial [Candidatus Firestonebacteria bacterium]
EAVSKVVKVRHSEAAGRRISTIKEILHCVQDDENALLTQSGKRESRNSRRCILDCPVKPGNDNETLPLFTHRLQKTLKKMVSP